MSVFDRIKAMVGDQEIDVNKAIEEVKRWREEDESKQFERFKNQIAEHQAKQSIGRSGILPLHMDCTIDNFIATSESQKKAKAFSKWYVDSFESNNGGGFIFGGTPGTGKNHLAAGICNALMARKKSCLVITVTELMQKLRNCYQDGSETTEDQFIRSMIEFDFLVLDEIGLQRGTDAERLALNQIVDQRISRFKPTGMLTNLSAKEMNACLGDRVMDRMRMNNGKWIAFDWESYRK
ncbi:hypothetical protein KKJFFJLC_00043 [Vibrio phage vB_VpaS_PGB]|nr:hypothetical protein HHKILHMN_00054 [Vibrio phage vB_VpaS_PGA]WVH05586.1 hypothetical protein KKJFFJLC_00043 [Vibrio phage vB_VpaS_PGB]